MNQKFSFRAIQQGQTQHNHVVTSGAGHRGRALVVDAAEGTRYQIADLNTFTSPKKLQLKRVGQDLLVALPGNDVNSPDIVIKNYFNFKDLSLTGLAVNGEPMAYDVSSFSLAPWAAAGITPNNFGTDKTSAATLASTSADWFIGGWEMAALGVGGLLIAAATGSSDASSSDNAATTSLTKITTFKGDATKPAPTETDFSNAGVTGVHTGNIVGIRSFLSTTSLALDTAESVQTLVDSYIKVSSEANGSAADDTSEDPTSLDYRNLMGSNIPASINDESQAYKAHALALLNDRIKGLSYNDIARYGSTTTGLKSYADLVEAIAVLVQSAPSTTGTAVEGITAAQLTSLGVVDVTATSLLAVSDALRASADDLSSLNTSAKLTALVKAYNTILAEANGIAADATTANPSAADYEAIGTDIGTAKTNTDALARLNAIIGNLASTAVDTSTEINKIAATLDKIQEVAAATGTDPLSDAQLFSAEELRNLGLTGFGGTEGQNKTLADKVSAAIRDKEVAEVRSGTGTGVKLVDGFKTAIDQTQLERLQALVSLEIIKNHVVDTNNSANSTLAPTLADWKAVGIFKPHATNASQLAELENSDVVYLNSAADKLLPSGTVLNDPAAVQTMADAYFKIIKEANGSAVDADSNSNPTASDFEAIGITGKTSNTSAPDHSNALKLLNDIVSTRNASEVSTVKQLQTLASLVDKIYDLAAQENTAVTTATQLSVSELLSLGMTGLTSSTTNNNALALKVSQAILDSDPATMLTGKGIRLDNGNKVEFDQTQLERLQALVSLEVIKNHVVDTNNSANTTIAPTLADWKAVGIFKPHATNAGQLAELENSDVAYLNSAADKLLPSSTVLNDPAAVQTMADAYFKIIKEANGSAVDVDSNSNPLASDFAAIGITGKTSNPSAADHANALKFLNDIVSARNATEVNTIKQLQTLADLVDKIYNLAAQENTAVTTATQLTVSELQNLGMTGLTSNATNNNALALKISQAILDSDPATMLTGKGIRLDNGNKVEFEQTQIERLQALVSLEVIKNHVVDTNNSANTTIAPTLADWRAVGVFKASVTDPSKFALLDGSELTYLNSATNVLASSAVDSTLKLQTMADSYFKIIKEANGTASDADVLSNPSKQDFVNIGAIEDSLSIENANLLASLMGEKLESQVNTITLIKDLLQTIQNAMNLADKANTASASSVDASDVSALSTSKLSTDLNLVGVNDKNHKDVLAAMQNKNMADIDTFAELQSLVSMTRVQKYATDASTAQTGTGGDITFYDWSNIIGLDNEIVGNLSVYNKAVDVLVASQVDELSELQAIVTNYNAYVSDWSQRVEAINISRTLDLFHSVGSQTAQNATIAGKLIDLAERSNGTATTNTTGAPFSFIGTDLTRTDLQSLGLDTTKIGNGFGTNDVNEMNNIWVAIQNSEPSQITLNYIQGIVNVWAPL